MLHSKSFWIGSLLGLMLWGCGSGKFEGASATSQLLSVEVDDSVQSQSSEGSLDASASGSDEHLDTADSGSKNPGSKHADKALCAQTLNGKQDLVRVTGSQQKVSIQSQEFILSRITGDRNQLDLSLNGKPSSGPSAGICLFIAGHENKASIKIQHPVSALYLKARGDNALVTIEVAKDIKIDAIVWDAKGNQPKLKIVGPSSSYPCPESSGKSQVICQ